MTPTLEGWLIESWGVLSENVLKETLYTDMEELHMAYHELVCALRLLHALHRDSCLTWDERAVKLDVCELMGR